jgi:hypothetical protein
MPIFANFLIRNAAVGELFDFLIKGFFNNETK